MWGNREGREELMEKKCQQNKDQHDKTEQALPVTGGGGFPGKGNSKSKCPEAEMCLQQKREGRC